MEVPDLVQAVLEGVAFAIKENLEIKLSRFFGCTAAEASKDQMYKATAMTVRDILTEKRGSFKKKVNQAGGIDPRVLISKRVLVGDDNIPGVIGAVAIHLQSAADRARVMGYREINVDIGARSKGEAEGKAPKGTYISFDTPYVEYGEGYACGKAFDDRACLVCLLHAMDLLQGKPLAVNVVVSASTKEETGFQGGISAGFKVQPEYAIAVDVTHARTGDAPQVICKLGDGPDITLGSNSNPKFARKMIEVARAKQIPHIVTACPSASGTNAWPIQMQGRGVTTLVVSLPLKYMHSPVEMLRMSDVKNVGKLIAAFIETFDGRL